MVNQTLIEAAFLGLMQVPQRQIARSLVAHMLLELAQESERERATIRARSKHPMPVNVGTVSDAMMMEVHGHVPLYYGRYDRFIALICDAYEAQTLSRDEFSATLGMIALCKLVSQSSPARTRMLQHAYAIHGRYAASTIRGNFPEWKDLLEHTS